MADFSEFSAAGTSAAEQPKAYLYPKRKRDDARRRGNQHDAKAQEEISNVGDFLETRFKGLQRANPTHAAELYAKAQEEISNRFHYYQESKKAYEPAPKAE